MASVMIRERANLSTYQFAICTGRRRLVNCFETIFCIRTLGNDLKRLPYEGVRLDRILFDFYFVSIVTSAIGGVELFTFVFTDPQDSFLGELLGVKGLLTFLGYFCPYYNAREVCVLETHLHDVASCHAPIIKCLHFYFRLNSCARLKLKNPSLLNLMFLLHCYCPHTRTAEAISVSAIELIKSMFPLHVLRCRGCTCFCFLDASSLSEPGFTVTSNSPGALEEEEDIVMKGSLEGFVGDFVKGHLEEYKNGNENKNELFLWHCWLGLCPGWPPPRAVFIVGHNFGNPNGWISVGGRIYTPCGTVPDGFARGPWEKNDHEFLFPEVVTSEGCFRFIVFLEAQTCGPRAPQGSLGFRRVRRNSANSPGASQVSSWPSAAVFVCCFDPGTPQGSFDPPGGPEQFSRTSVVHRGVPRGSQVPLGTPGVQEEISETLAEGRRPQWLARGRYPFGDSFQGSHSVIECEIWELVRNQVKGEGIGMQMFVQLGRFDACIGFAFQFQHFIV